jgi:hypothetical protein
MYPQLRLPTDPSLQVSGELSAMVVGDFKFEGMNHPTRVERLVALIKLYEAVMEIGDHEHTGDWDWRITVTWDYGRKVSGTYDGKDLINYSDAMLCDHIKLDYTVEPNDYLTDFARWKLLTVEEFGNRDGDLDYPRVPIDSITNIHITRA